MKTLLIGLSVTVPIMSLAVWDPEALLIAFCLSAFTVSSYLLGSILEEFF